MDFWLLARLLLCFLAGSIPFAVVAMWGTGIDITQVGSRNPGFNNVLRVASKPRALVALVGDLFKGTAALFVFSALLGSDDSLTVRWSFGLAAVVGHCFTPWLRFRGGKGVATSAGVLLYLHWWQALVGGPVYFLVRLYGKRRGWEQRGAVASLAMLAVITALVVVYAPPPAAWFAGALFVLVVLRHTSNLREALFGKKVQAPGA